MEDRTVLSAEEVDALIKAAAASDHGAEEFDSQESDTSSINTSALNVIIENTRAAIENRLTVLLRKKIAVTIKPAVTTNFIECAKNSAPNVIYSAFKLMPYDSLTLVACDHGFIDAAINLLYGGKIQTTAPEAAPLGKIGLITAENLSLIMLESLLTACRGRVELTPIHHKTAMTLNNMISETDTDDVYANEITIMIEEVEARLTLYLTEEFLIKLLPVKTGSGKHKERDFWRTAIKSEVVDSYVTINTTISDVRIKVKDFMSLKVGDEIPISDPTLVYVCLNNLKLFKGLAGQSNSKIVAKIVGQV